MQNVSEGRLIRNALGAQWDALPATIRTRFAADPPEATCYLGTMTEVNCSRFGWIMAQAARCFGAPLIPYRGRDVRIEVMVTAPGNGDVIKRRIYFFPGRKPIKVQSSMRISPQGRFQECVNGGIGMEMRIFVEDDALHFVSERYYFSVAGRQWPIPSLFTPGRSHVMHRDAADGQFQVRIEMLHPLFGRTFLQDGLFREHPVAF